MSDEHNKLCSYEQGPCVAMERHSRKCSHSTVRSGIAAMDNMVNLSGSGRLMHMGFALRGPGVSGPKDGVMLNFCPWCGGNLREWYESYQEDLRCAGEVTEDE